MTQELIVPVLTILGSVFAFYLKLKKDIITEYEKNQKTIIELNESITKLNTTITYLNDYFETLKKRVDAHGKEIDRINILIAKLHGKDMN